MYQCRAPSRQFVRQETPCPDKTVSNVEVIRFPIIIPDGFVAQVFVIMEVPRLFGIISLQCPSAAVLSGDVPFVFPNDLGCLLGGLILILQ